jgi:hypothetical protein
MIPRARFRSDTVSSCAPRKERAVRDPVGPALADTARPTPTGRSTKTQPAAHEGDIDYLLERFNAVVRTRSARRHRGCLRRAATRSSRPPRAPPPPSCLSREHSSTEPAPPVCGGARWGRSNENRVLAEAAIDAAAGPAGEYPRPRASGRRSFGAAGYRRASTAGPHRGEHAEPVERVDHCAEPVRRRAEEPGAVADEPTASVRRYEGARTTWRRARYGPLPPMKGDPPRARRRPVARTNRDTRRKDRGHAAAARWPSDAPVLVGGARRRVGPRWTPTHAQVDAERRSPGAEADDEAATVCGVLEIADAGRSRPSECAVERGSGRCASGPTSRVAPRPLVEPLDVVAERSAISLRITLSVASARPDSG